MRKLLILSMVCFALVMPRAFGLELAWYNQEQVLDQNGIPVAPGGLVQLICAGDDGIVNDPYEWWMAQEDPCAAMNAWIAGGCLPVGDDFLFWEDPTSNPQGIPNSAPNPTYIRDLDPGNQEGWGYFDGFYMVPDPTKPTSVGKVLYTRFFTAEVPGECDWYGVITGWYDMAGTLHTEPYILQGIAYPVLAQPGAQVTQHIECGIIPEPASASMLLGGIGLLLAFFRRKK